MSSRESERESLYGPWPSASEEVLGRFGERWEIYRELLDTGRHGDWIARILPGLAKDAIELRSDTIDDLAERLAVADAAYRRDVR